MNAHNLMKPVLLLWVFALSACTADIRPDSLQEITSPKRSDSEKGRELLRQAARAHGAAQFAKVDSYTMVLRDDWQGISRMLNPWPAASVDVKMSYRSRSFDGRAEFLSGVHKGITWGLQSWNTYTQRAGARPVFEENDDAAFILPAIQYLTEFLFRDHDDQIVTYVGPEEVRGVTYERVFLTWGNLEPRGEVDQYVVYIDPKTKRVAKIMYTVRDVMKMATGAIHFSDLRDIDGVLFPFTQHVTIDVHDDPVEDFAHRITLKSVTLNQPGLAAFEVNPRLPTVGDRKLSLLAR